MGDSKPDVLSSTCPRRVRWQGWPLGHGERAEGLNRVGKLSWEAQVLLQMLFRVWEVDKSSRVDGGSGVTGASTGVVRAKWYLESLVD